MAFLNATEVCTGPIIYTTIMVLSDTEYSQLLPKNTKRFELKCRDLETIRYSYESGNVASGSNYRSLLGNETKSEADINLTDTTIYFACSLAGKIFEIEVWI